MKTVIGVLFAISVAPIVLAKWIDHRSPAVDVSSSIVPYVFGLLLLVADLALLVGYALWRLFT